MIILNRHYICGANPASVLTGYTYDNPPSGLRLYRFRYPLYLENILWDLSFSDQLNVTFDKKSKGPISLKAWKHIIGSDIIDNYDESSGESELLENCKRHSDNAWSLYAYAGLISIRGEYDIALRLLEDLVKNQLFYIPVRSQEEVRNALLAARIGQAVLVELINSRIARNKRYLLPT